MYHDEGDSPEPIALVAEDRLAVHVVVTAEDLSWALSTAALRWREGVRHLGIRGWRLVRAEVASWDEFMQERNG